MLSAGAAAFPWRLRLPTQQSNIWMTYIPKAVSATMFIDIVNMTMLLMS